MHPLLIPNTHTDLEVVAKELVFSQYTDIDQSQCYLKMLLGVSMGLTIFEALHGITFEAGLEGKPGKVIVEPFALIERVVVRSDSYEVKVAHSDELHCELNFFQNAKIKGQHSLTREDLVKRNIQPSTGNLFQVAYAQGVQKFFPHLFGHKFYLRIEVPISKQEQVKSIVAQSNNKVVTADQLGTTRKPASALSPKAQKIVDWQKAYHNLSLGDPHQWDKHLAQLNGFDFLNDSQKDDLFDELIGHGISVGVEYNNETRLFFVYQLA